MGYFRILALFLLGTQVVIADSYVLLGKGVRQGSYNLVVGKHLIKTDNAKLGLEVEFSSMGAQPRGFQNVNKMINLTGVTHARLSDRWHGFGKFGANNTYYSHNGSNSYSRKNDSLWGWVASVGLEYELTDSVYTHVGVATHEYRQVNNPNMGGFTHSYAGIRIEL